jgi:hypothetical protein
MKEEIYEKHPFLSDDGFLELASAVVTALRKGDDGYAALTRRKKELEERFPFIESVLEGAAPVSLSEDEHAGLSEYMDSPSRWSASSAGAFISRGTGTASRI